MTRGCIPGLEQKFRLYNFPVENGPTEGDILRRTTTGSCYVIEAIRPGREPGRYVADVVGLGVDAADECEPGVWLMGPAR